MYRGTIIFSEIKSYTKEREQSRALTVCSKERKGTFAGTSVFNFSIVLFVATQNCNNGGCQIIGLLVFRVK